MVRNLDSYIVTPHEYLCFSTEDKSSKIFWLVLSFLTIYGNTKLTPHQRRKERVEEERGLEEGEAGSCVVDKILSTFKPVNVTLSLVYSCEEAIVSVAGSSIPSLVHWCTP